MKDFEKIKNQIALALQGELPGKVSQHKMAPLTRKIVHKFPEDAKGASVMALLYPKEGNLHTVFIKRPSKNPKDKHSGQVSFPGGKIEAADSSKSYTAKRETFEEIGVPVNAITIIGQLTALYIPVSNFLVFPFVGCIDFAPDFIPQEEEVDEILEMPLDNLLKPSIRSRKNVRIRENIILQDVPYFDIKGHVVWGATAMILSELTDLIYSAGIAVIQGRPGNHLV